MNRALLITLLAPLVGCDPAPTYDWKVESATGYHIGSGDSLRISVWKHEEVSQQVTVRPDGILSLPLVGEVQASGRDAQEIAQDVAQRLHKYYQDDPPITVQVVDTKSYKVYVLGEVQKPGEVTPSHQITVLMGLALAGGFTRFANPDRVVIVRRDAHGERRIPFSYSDVIRNGRMEENLILQPGDTIIVP